MFDRLRYGPHVVAFCSLVGIQTLLGLLYHTAGKGGYAFSPALSLTMSESIKCCLACATLFWTAKDAKSILRKHATPSLLSRIFGLALLYAINNKLLFKLYTLSDPATLSVSKSFSSLVVALISFIALGKRYSFPKWVCLMLQVVGLSIIHLNVTESSGHSSSSITLMFLVLNASISGACSVWNSSLLSPEFIDLNAFNFFLYAFGVIFNLLTYWFYEGMQHSFLQGWSFLSLGILLCNSLIGLAISAVFKFSGALTRTWATAIATCALYSIVLLLGWAMFPLVPIAQGVLIVFGCAYLFQTLSDQPAASASVKQTFKEENKEKESV